MKLRFELSPYIKNSLTSVYIDKVSTRHLLSYGYFPGTNPKSSQLEIFTEMYKVFHQINGRFIQPLTEDELDKHLPKQTLNQFLGK